MVEANGGYWLVRNLSAGDKIEHVFRASISQDIDGGCIDIKQFKPTEILCETILEYINQALKCDSNEWNVKEIQLEEAQDPLENKIQIKYDREEERYRLWNEIDVLELEAYFDYQQVSLKRYCQK